MQKNKEYTHKAPDVSESEGGVGERRTDDKEKSGSLSNDAGWLWKHIASIIN